MVPGVDDLLSEGALYGLKGQFTQKASPTQGGSPLLGTRKDGESVSGPLQGLR